jgi:hypothetical protein
MPFITSSEVQPAFKTKTAALAESIQFSEYRSSFDVFLCHASEDAEVILGVMAILDVESATAYVYWIVDQQLDQTQVTPATAQMLRKRMCQFNSLIFVSTKGFRLEKISIFPVVDYSYSDFKGQEYLGLYPAINAKGILRDETVWGMEGYCLGTTYRTQRVFQ